jgi:hypothetical protein
LNEKGEIETYCLVLPPIGAEILSSSRVLHVDVKHKSRNQKQNTHHLGVAVRIEEFKGYSYDRNCFCADIFLTHLTEKSFRKAFYSLLETLKSNGIQVVNFIRNLEFIISDFSLAQKNGIGQAIQQILSECGSQRNVEELFSGCFFHFKQSVKRMKDKLNKNEKKIFDTLVNKKLLSCGSKTQMLKQMDNIQQTLPETQNWAVWWKKEPTLSTLYSCIHQPRHQNTNNLIENLHSHMSDQHTAVLSYKSAMERFLSIYVELANLTRRQTTLRYTKDTKRRKFLKRKKKIVKNRPTHSQDHSGQPPHTSPLHHSSNPSHCQVINHNSVQASGEKKKRKRKRKKVETLEFLKQSIQKRKEKKTDNQDSSNKEEEEDNQYSESNSSCDEEHDKEGDGKQPSQSKIWNMIQKGDLELGKRHRKKKNFD